MSKRQPSRWTVRLMPPTTSSDSRIVTRRAWPGLHQLVRGGEPGGTGADDDDREIGPASDGAGLGMLSAVGMTGRA